MEAGEVTPKEFYQPIIAETFGTVTHAMFPVAPKRDADADVLAVTGMNTLELVSRLQRSDLDQATLDGLRIMADRLCSEYPFMQLGSWAGLTPRHYESDTKVIRGHVTKQGSRMLRWAVTEAIQRQPAGSRPGEVKDAIIARRGKEAKNIAKIAAARELLTLVYYGMRDGRVRRLAAPRLARPHDRPPARREAASYSAPRHQARGRRTFCPPPGPAARPARPGGAGARLIGPARSLTRTRPMPPGQPCRGQTKG